MFNKLNLFIRSGVLIILFLAATSLALNAQTPIPGHAGVIIDGVNGGLLKAPNSVFVSGNFAYVASGGGNSLEIIDVSNPASPVNAGRIVDGASGALLMNPTSVFVSGNYAYVASAASNALEIIDVTAPNSPFHIGSLTDGTGGAMLTSPSAVYVLGTIAYVVSSTSNSLEIVDVTNPASPTHLGSIVDGTGGALLGNPLSVFVSGTLAYIASAGSNAIEIIDVTDPANPFHKGNLIDGGAALLNAPASLVVYAGFAFVASSGSNALEIVNVTDPTAPMHVGSIANGGGAILSNSQSVFLQGNYAYVASKGGNALEIIDVTTPSSPQHLASLSNGAGGAALASPTSVFVSGSSAFVTSASGNALEIINLFTPLPPTATAATSISETSFTAKWNAISNATSFEIDVSADNFTNLLAGYNPATTANASLVVSGLTGCTNYQIKVRGVNADGTSTDSNVISVTTAVTTPTAIAASAFSQTGFTANWNSISCATGYYLDVAMDNAFTSTLASYNNLLVNGTSQSVTGLSAGATYFYRVRSTNANGTSSSSNVITTITIPNNPSATSASTVGQTSFTANWSSVTGATGYYLDVASDNTFSTLLASYNNIPVTVTSKSVSGLTAGTNYYYRVRSSNASGTSFDSNVISTITISQPPTVASATSINQTGFTANWSSITGASDYLLDVATDNAFSSILSAYHDLPVTGTSQSVIGLNPATTYYYRVRSNNAGGISPYSFASSVLTVTADPVAIAASLVTQTSFTANWNSVTGASGYHLDVATDNAFTSILSTYNLTGTLQTVTSLNAGTIYYYRVRSSNASGTSLNSNIITVITIPANPIATTATSIAQSSFIANWNSVSGASGYNLDVATDAAFSAILPAYNNFSVSGTSQSVTGLTGGTSYYYRLRSKNASGTSSNSNVVSLITDQATATQNIPTLQSGGTLESYSMFSIPLVVQSNDSTISTLFASQGEYKPDKWRLLRWNSTAANWDEYQNGLSTIDRGKSYWFNSVSPATIPVTGKPFLKPSFSLHLNSGWNQIGSPYDFDVSWTDVLAQNSLVPGVLLVETNLYKYVFTASSNGFAATDNLKAWGGGYVFNGGSPITLKIPITVMHASGRISSTHTNQFTNASDWFLPLKLSVNNVENNYSGIGMHTEANSSYDRFDGITVPRFIKYLELNSYHHDFFEPYFTRDVVKTASNHNWHFTAETNLENQNATLTWDHQSLGSSHAQLILFDPITGAIVDIMQNDHYSFKIQNKHPLCFFYATDKENFKPDITTLASAYPNPVSTTVTFPVFIANSSQSVQLEIYDNMGKVIKTILNSNVEQGLHMEQWDCTDHQGVRVASGMYIYRFVGENNVMQTGKLIVK